jgi:hypothetical protein
MSDWTDDLNLGDPEPPHRRVKKVVQTTYSDLDRFGDVLMESFRAGGLHDQHDARECVDAVRKGDPYCGDKTRWESPVNITRTELEVSKEFKGLRESSRQIAIELLAQ